MHFIHVEHMCLYVGYRLMDSWIVRDLPQSPHILVKSYDVNSDMGFYSINAYKVFD